MDKQELEDLMKKAENGTLTKEELVPLEAVTILMCYQSAMHAYGKYKRKEVFSLDEVKKIFRHAMYEMAEQEHGAKALYIPSLLLIYQDLCTKPEIEGVK